MIRKLDSRVLAHLELLVAALIIVLDLFLPTLLVLALLAASLIIRKQGLSTVGFFRSQAMSRMALMVLLLVVIWTLFQLGIAMPVLNRLMGTRQDLSAYVDLRGNLPSLLLYLALTWSLAAFGEEIVYRGYLQRRVFDVLGTGRLGTVVAIGMTSLLFGLAHSEQGGVGIVVTILDAIFFSLLKLYYKGNLWAAILAHGFSNTLGLVAFYFVGPIYSFW